MKALSLPKKVQNNLFIQVHHCECPWYSEGAKQALFSHLGYFATVSAQQCHYAQSGKGVSTQSPGDYADEIYQYYFNKNFKKYVLP